MKRLVWLGVLIAACCLLAGCAPKRYVVTTPLVAVTEQPTQIRIGPIQDNLPDDTEPDRRPTTEDMEKFRTYLAEEISGSKKLQMKASSDSGACCYEVRAALMEYKKGSGFLRFLIGFGAGTASMTTALSLVDTRTNATVFSGNFISRETRGMVSGSQIYRQTSKDFVKALEEENSNLAKK